jgi:hypothetical protein
MPIRTPPCLRKPLTDESGRRVRQPHRASPTPRRCHAAAPTACAGLFWLLLLVTACQPGRHPEHALLDPDEGRNAEWRVKWPQAATGVVPHYSRLPYLDKPVLYFAAVAASFRSLRPGEAAARGVSFLFALGALALTWRLTARRFGVERARWAVLLLASAPLFVGFSRIVIFDMALTFFVLAAWWAAEEGRHGARWGYAVAWAAAALALLTKGPVALLLFLIGALLLALGDAPRARMGRFFHPLNLALFVALVAPWVAVGATSPASCTTRSSSKRPRAAYEAHVPPQRADLVLPAGAASRLLPLEPPLVGQPGGSGPGGMEHAPRPRSGAGAAPGIPGHPRLLFAIAQQARGLHPAGAAAARPYRLGGHGRSAIRVDLAARPGAAPPPGRSGLPGAGAPAPADGGPLKQPPEIESKSITCCATSACSVSASEQLSLLPARRPPGPVTGALPASDRRHPGPDAPLRRGQLLRAIVRALGPAAADSAAFVTIRCFPTGLPYYLRRAVPLVTDSGNEMTSTYVARTFADRRSTPGGILWSSAELDSALARGTVRFVLTRRRDQPPEGFVAVGQYNKVRLWTRER